MNWKVARKGAVPSMRLNRSFFWTAHERRMRNQLATLS